MPAFCSNRISSTFLRHLAIWALPSRSDILHSQSWLPGPRTHYAWSAHGSQNVSKERLKFSRPFVYAARKLLDSLSEKGYRTLEQWTNAKWSMKCSRSMSAMHAFILRVSTRPMGLPRKSCVKLHLLRSGLGRFCSSMRKWGLAPFSNCECGTTEQTADHII